MKYYAFTLVDLVAAIVIVTLVGCLIFPSIQASRETARRQACMNNLRQIGVAIQQYHDVHKTLPGHKVGPGAGNRKSVFTNLLPQLGQQAIYDELIEQKWQVPWDIFSTSGRRLYAIDSVSGADRCFAAFWFLLWFLLLLFLWALLGGMICRTAALRLTVDRSESFGETWRFLKERGNGFLSSIVILSLGIGFCTLPILLGGYLFSLPGLNYVVGLAFPLVLLFAFFAILLALGLYVGWPLLFAAVSVDGSDGYDAVSRMFSYVFQRPLHYLVYWTLSAVLGVLGFIFISIFLDGMVYVAVTLGGFPATAALPSLGHLAIPETTAELAGPNMLVLVWCALAQLLKLAFAFSWFFTTGISVYLLLRRSVDATPFNEVLLLGPAAAEAQTLPAIKTDAKGAPEMCDVS